MTSDPHKTKVRKSSRVDTVAGNRLLAMLPPADLARIMPNLTLLPLATACTLCAHGNPDAGVFFIETGLVSTIIRFENGDLSEVGLVGDDGIIGLSSAQGIHDASTEHLIQQPGTAQQMRFADFRKELDRNHALGNLLLTYALYTNAQMAYTAACNGRHTLDKRLARWLLMMDDRTAGLRSALTHDGISMMLSTRRGAVTIAAGLLRDAGLITYKRGHITITDRLGLEAASCECYRSLLPIYAGSPLAYSASGTDTLTSKNFLKL